MMFQEFTAVLPTAYNISADMYYDAYSGAGVDWNHAGVLTQVYGGNVYNPIGGNDHSNRRLIGTRITWNTPLEGLRFLVSANETQLEANVMTLGSPTPQLSQLGKEDRAMFSVDYVSDRFDIKSEYNYHKTPAFPLLDNRTNIANAWYVQGGYKMGAWIPYARFDSFQTDQSKTSDPSIYQKNWVVGVNYKINESVNARIEDHVIRGYGVPVAGGEVAASSGTKNWNLIAAEVNFLF